MVFLLSEVSMAEGTKPQISWPKNSWSALKRMIRAWYAAEESGGEVTQKKIADMAGVQPSQLSVNKAFLQDIGIVEPGGIALTEAGKRIGVGLSNENERAKQQGLQQIVKNYDILRDLWDLARGRGNLSEGDFEVEISLRTRQSKNTPGFTMGVGVLQDILLDSGLVEIEDGTLRPIRGLTEEIERKETPTEESRTHSVDVSVEANLRKIPVPVSATSIWYIWVAENPDDGDVDRFIEMQKLIFGRK
jgi:hypothetical protein